LSSPNDIPVAQQGRGFAVIKGRNKSEQVQPASEQNARAKYDWSGSHEPDKPPKRDVASTKPLIRSFRKVSSTSTQGDEGNVYDPNKTQEEKDQLRLEIQKHNKQRSDYRPEYD
jgi:hypothetical protein